MQGMHRIEFTGGPFDGHIQKVTLEPTELAAVALLPVSRTVYAWLAGHTNPAQTRVTSIAEYRLELADGRCRYRFEHALDPATTRIRS